MRTANAPKLFCPNERSLLDRLEGRPLCVRVNAASEIAAAASAAGKRDTLCCVLWNSEHPLDETDIREDWQSIPIALMVPSVGRFSKLAKKLPLLRKSNLRVHLPCDADNLIGARLLASVGVETCVVFDAGETPDWDALADLMTYALLATAPHAPIEPFRLIADSCGRGARNEDWRRAYFEDPSRYLHLDAAGKIALSHRELVAGKFIADDLTKLDSPEVKEAIENRTEAWRDLFLDNHFCARCEAWRLCGGKFAEGATAPNGCATFFSEMADVVEQYRRNLKSRQPEEKWRP